MRQAFFLILILVFLISGCRNSNSGKSKEIIVFHAGSLSVPFKQIKNEYEKINPDIKILLEPAGSLVCARKITELKKPCDIIASADYFVINELLIPEYTKWSIRFATNEIVIAFNEKSKYSSEINDSNWIDILLKDDVIYSRSDPNSDPCGYRTVFTLMLAEKHYHKQGLTEKIVSKNKEFIRPKEVDLVALIETNAIDYMFQYKSVAIQHGLKYIELPDEINLSDPAKNELYNSVSLDVTGSKPGTKMKVTGDYINYSMTVLNNAPQKSEAIDFMCYILSEEGLNVLRKNGQNPIIPFSTEQPDKIPTKLSQYLPDVKIN
jgi:molybdate/tungstate transport system substrate-binding protein